MLRVFKQLFSVFLIVTYATQASAMFIQPDWFDPTEPGVGTNRYAYSFSDPVNKLDPGGNEAVEPWDGPDPSERDLLDEELHYLSDVMADPNMSAESKLEYVRDLYGRINGYNLSQPAWENQAIGLGVLAEAWHKLQNAPEAAVGARPTPEATATVAVGARVSTGPREAVSGQSSVLPTGIGIGPYASPTGGVPASKVNARPTAAEARAVQQSGKPTVCHTCGTPVAGTKSGRFIVDHQPPTSLNPTMKPQQFYPHCATCSARQGGLLRWFSH